MQPLRVQNNQPANAGAGYEQFAFTKAGRMLSVDKFAETLELPTRMINTILERGEFAGVIRDRVHGTFITSNCAEQIWNQICAGTLDTDKLPNKNSISSIAKCVVSAQNSSTS